jgi:hypothetical protein
MWRRAHGRLAAIAVLAGGLSICLPTAPPRRAVATTASNEDETQDEREHDHPGCGGVHDDRTPEQRLAEMARHIEEAAKPCKFRAQHQGRHGEAEVKISKSGALSVSRAPRSELTEVDEACITTVVRAVLGSERDWTAGYNHELVVHLALGKSPALFGPAPKLFAQWFAAMRSKPARKRFIAQLPAEVALDNDDRCLSMPDRPLFTEGLDGWIADAGTPLSIYWQPDNDPSLRHHGDLIAGLTAHGNPKTHAYLVGGDGLLLRNPPKADEREQSVCLLPLDQTLRQELQARVDRRATCWVGDLRDILLEPRTEFRANRPLKSVAVGLTRTCALDARGVPVCCGERTDKDPPAGGLARIAVGTDFDCGINADGGLACWGYSPPARDTVMPGPYAQVVVAERNMCALRRDTHALECWLGEPPRMVTVARDKIRELAVLHDAVCALGEDGKVACRGFYMDAKWRQIQGAFRAFAASFHVVCGMTAPESRELRCWEDDWRGWRRAPPPDPDGPIAMGFDEPTDLAMSGSDGCVLGRSGRIKCWRSPARRAWSDVYRMLAGGEIRLCALTVEGRVECDREWPYFK